MIIPATKIIFETYLTAATGCFAVRLKKIKYTVEKSAGAMVIKPNPKTISATLDDTIFDNPQKNATNNARITGTDRNNKNIITYSFEYLVNRLSIGKYCLFKVAQICFWCKP